MIPIHTYTHTHGHADTHSHACNIHTHTHTHTSASGEDCTRGNGARNWRIHESRAQAVADRPACVQAVRPHAWLPCTHTAASACRRTHTHTHTHHAHTPAPAMSHSYATLHLLQEAEADLTRGHEAKVGVTQGKWHPAKKKSEVRWPTCIISIAPYLRICLVSYSCSDSGRTRDSPSPSGRSGGSKITLVPTRYVSLQMPCQHTPVRTVCCSMPAGEPSARCVYNALFIRVYSFICILL